MTDIYVVQGSLQEASNIYCTTIMLSYHARSETEKRAAYWPRFCRCTMSSSDTDAWQRNLVSWNTSEHLLPIHVEQSKRPKSLTAPFISQMLVQHMFSVMCGQSTSQSK